MPHKNILHKLFNSIILVFISCAFIFAQETPYSDGSDSSLFTDTIPSTENLLDSNQVYKQQFDSLSKDGDWIDVKKSDFVRDLSKGTGEDFSDFSSDDGEYISFWRPYGADANWNPYMNGRWEFSYYGWIWMSDYSWGWGPYHYGRWYFSNYYGWIWMPGNMWAANWVMWRHNNLYAGWYPTCPQIYWRDHRHNWHRNRVYSCEPRNWVFVGKPNFTKKIDENVINKNEYARILKNSANTGTAVYSDNGTKKFKYTGPDVKVVSKETGANITPVNFDLNISKTGDSKNNLTKTESKNSNVNSERNIPPVTNGQKTGTEIKKDSKAKNKKAKEDVKYKTPDYKGTKKDPPVKEERGSKDTNKPNYNEPKNENNDGDKNEGSKDDNNNEGYKGRK